MKQRSLVQFPIACKVRNVLTNVINTFCFVFFHSEWRKSMINLVLANPTRFCTRQKSKIPKNKYNILKIQIKETIGISFVNFLFADTNPCRLLCKRGARVVQYGTVIDGTRCSLNTKIKDVCIEGKCRVSYPTFVWVNYFLLLDANMSL